MFHFCFETDDPTPDSPRRGRAPSALALLAIVILGEAFAAPTPAQRCQATKTMIAARYENCRQAAEAAVVINGDEARFASAVAKCLRKYRTAWSTAENKAAARGVPCPSTGDEGVVQLAIDQHTTRIATALAGHVLEDCTAALDVCQASLDERDGALQTCEDDLGVCDPALAACQVVASTPGRRLSSGQTSCSDANGTTVPCAGTGQDGEDRTGLGSAYTDNGDGTITDANTGLMWEKLCDDSSVHDRDTTYTWTAAFAKVGTLNAARFAGHDDWRLPNVNELQSLARYAGPAPAVDTAFNTGCASLCTVLTCSCTQPNRYWSSTSYGGATKNAWYVLFLDGSVSPLGVKTASFYVRAVRGGV